MACGQTGKNYDSDFPRQLRVWARRYALAQEFPRELTVKRQAEKTRHSLPHIERRSGITHVKYQFPGLHQLPRTTGWGWPHSAGVMKGRLWPTLAGRDSIANEPIADLSANG